MLKKSYGALQKVDLNFFHNPTIRFTILSLTLTILGIIFWSLDRGLGMLDEAYYLLHFEEGAYPIAASNWFVLAKPFYNIELFTLRTMVFFWLLSSSFFLGFAFSKYWGFKWPAWYAGVLSVFALFVLSIPVQYVPNNVTFNILFIYSSLGFLFLSTASRGRKKALSILFILFSGFCLGFLPFVMITNSPLIGVVLIAVYLFHRQDRPFFYTGIWLLGIFFSVACYFMLFQPWEEFIYKFEEAVIYTQYMGSHGIRPLILWHLDTMLYFLGMPLALCIILYFWATEKLSEKTWSNRIIILLGVVILITLVVIDITSKKAVFSTTLFFIFALCSFLILLKSKPKWESKYLGLVLLALVPYFATLGTDVPFQVRSAGYFSVLFLMIVALLGVIGIEKLKVLFLGFLVIVFLNFLSYPFRAGWAKYKISQQTEVYSLPNGKGSLKLSSPVLENTKAVFPFLKGKKQVVISHPNLWGYVYLSGAQALNLHFMPNEAYIRYFLEKQSIDLNSLTFMEGKFIRFSETFKSDMMGSENFNKIDLGDIIIYQRKSAPNE